MFKSWWWWVVHLVVFYHCFAQEIQSLRVWKEPKKIFTRLFCVSFFFDCFMIWLWSNLWFLFGDVFHVWFFLWLCFCFNFYFWCSSNFEKITQKNTSFSEIWSYIRAWNYTRVDPKAFYSKQILIETCDFHFWVMFLFQMRFWDGEERDNLGDPQSGFCISYQGFTVDSR